MEKKSTKVDFSHISCKKAPFYTRNGTFKDMLLLSTIYVCRAIIISKGDVPTQLVKKLLEGALPGY